MAKVKFNGTNKARVSWNSMGKVYSYNVRPGEVLGIPDDQVNNICATGPFIIISGPKKKNKGPKINKKVINTVVEKPVKVVKPKPIVEEKKEPVVESPVVEEPIVEEEHVVEEEPVVEEITEDEETKVLPAYNEIKDETNEEDEVDGIDYTSLLKDELKEMCRERGLKISGNRDDLISRLVAYDNGVTVDY